MNLMFIQGLDHTTVFARSVRIFIGMDHKMNLPKSESYRDCNKSFLAKSLKCH